MKIHLKTIAVLCLVLASVLVVSGCLSSDKDSKDFDNVGMTSFKSEKEMQAFLSNIVGSGSGSGPRAPTAPGSTSNDMAATAVAESAESPASVGGSSHLGGGDSYSTTNVQIAGVDEADLVKTDGKIIYYTPHTYYPSNITFIDDVRYPYYSYDIYQITYIIDALPAATASIIAEIVETGGNLYLFNDTLIVIKTGWENRSIVAYDVSDPAFPVKAWEQSYDGYLSHSRMVDGKLYLITQEYGISHYPIMFRGAPIAYSDCYYPYGPSLIMPNTDSAYFISKIDVETGNFDKTIALIGNYYTTLFASGTNLYLTNHYYPNTQLMYLDFVVQNGSNYFPSDVMSHIRKVMGYDLSDYIKYLAVSEAIGKYYDSIDSDDPWAAYSQFSNDYNAYASALIVETEKTTITKVCMESFDVVSGFVPGRVHNQFFMDEGDGSLRVLSAKGDNWWGDRSTTAVVTVFDSNMEVIGQLDGLAYGEYIQSARYIGNTLYITTYSDADPFLVIDLSDKENPKLLGNMKLTGSYSYLYPINDTLIVGFGSTADWRDWRPKLTLYDVSDPTRPIELSTYYFDRNEYASLYDYHGFTWIPDRNLMVVPGYNNAFVFQIKDGSITLVKKEDTNNLGYIVRSVYIGSNLYFFSNQQVHVYDMDSWRLVRTISIPQPVYPDYGLIYPVGTEERPVAIV
ncbi:MAG: beta-propeller domain-containing protein [Methanimicrococcus sp.]|nr:beta-propeller domain-containing protein [Methanimicrococcus sp.]